jgi:hypothetical protein
MIEKAKIIRKHSTVYCNKHFHIVFPLFFQSKNQATAIFSFDLDGDGVKELITGWSSGNLEELITVRSSRVHHSLELDLMLGWSIEIRLYRKGTYILADIHGMDHFCTKLALPPYNKPRSCVSKIHTPMVMVWFGNV